MKKLLTLTFILLSSNAYAGCYTKPLKPMGYCLNGQWQLVCTNGNYIWLCTGQNSQAVYY